MNANELRIGNLFIEENSKEIIEVIGLEKNRIVFSGMFLDKWQAKPIPLTEEWLLKFGFVITETNAGIECFYFGKRYSVLQPSNTNLWLLVDGEKGLCEIQFIHQLQNLYFALTNTELICETK